MCEMPQVTAPPALQLVGRAPDAKCTSVQNMCVDHGGADVRMAEQFLNGSNVVAALEQVPRK